MKKRKISTISQPLLSSDGTIMKNMRVAFVLVDETGRPCDTFDFETGEHIAGNPVYVRTDVNGEFEVELFPNTRGTTPTYYLVRVLDADVDDFVAALQDGTTSIDLLEFKYGGVTISKVDYDLIQKYIDKIEDLLTGLIDDASVSASKTWSSEKIVTEVYTPSKFYLFEQSTPSAEWIVNHELNRPVNVTIYDSENSLVTAKVKMLDWNTVKITFSEALAGQAYVR